MSATLYRPRIDFWLGAVWVFAMVILVVCCLGTPWWIPVLYGILINVLMIGGVYGTYYTIDGDTFTVYQFFRPHPFPISKISEVKYCTGYLAGPATSSRRLAIKFSDRKILKSYAPLEISPKDRDGFVARLLSVNPAIKVEK